MPRHILQILLFFSLAGVAGLSHADCAKYRRTFAAVAQGLRVDRYLLEAMGQVESNCNPKLSAVNKNGTWDRGLMMINSSHDALLRAAGFSEADVYDPTTNIVLGGFVLQNCIKRHGMVWRAVGCYNSGSPKKQMIYVAKVQAAYRRVLMQAAAGGHGAAPAVQLVSMGARPGGGNASAQPPLRIITGGNI